MWFSLAIYFTIYTTLLGLIVFVGYLIQSARESNYAVLQDGIDPKSIVVLIPFRNEEHRIGQLLEDINGMRIQPKEWVFINDHSDDHSTQLIQQELSIDNYKILDCPDTHFGKKKAIRWGTDQSESEYILTIDADVEMGADYFDHIAKLGQSDMYVLPVRMQAGNVIQQFFIIDHLLVTAANAGLAGLIRPIMASGANLLYNREAFEIADDLDSHQHMASGDDTYLLRDFRRKEHDVRLCVNPAVEVSTQAPQSIREFLDQRLRWIGKTNDLKDHLSTLLAILQSALTIIFLFVLFYFVGVGNWMGVMIMLLAKTTIDMILFLPFMNARRALVSWLFIPLYELFFPIYTIILLALLPFYKPKWKGRKIYETN